MVKLKGILKAIVKTILIVISVVALLMAILVAWVFWQSDIQHVKGQELIAESESPEGTYTVYAYLNNGGATTSFSVLGTVKNNRTGKTRNIYWNYHCDSAKIEWISDQVVSINSVKLDVTTDAYDYRKPKKTAAEEIPDGVRYLGYITSLDDEKIVLDKVEWITENMTDRIEELGLNVMVDLPGGFYIYNESDNQSIFTTRGDCKVQLNNFDTGYQPVDMTYDQFKEKFLANEYEIDSLSEGLYWIEYWHGEVISITQQYVP